MKRCVTMLWVVIVLGALLSAMPREARACAGNLHAWTTIREEHHEGLATGVAIVLLDELRSLAQRLVASRDPSARDAEIWELGMARPLAASGPPEVLVRVAAADQAGPPWTWRKDLSRSRASAPVRPVFGLGLTVPGARDYAWLDLIAFRWPLLRSGSSAHVTARVVALASDGRALLADEWPLRDLLELDLLLPGPPLLGGAWIRHLTRYRTPMAGPREWFLCWPPAAGATATPAVLGVEEIYWPRPDQQAAHAFIHTRMYARSIGLPELTVETLAALRSGGATMTLILVGPDPMALTGPRLPGSRYLPDFADESRIRSVLPPDPGLLVLYTRDGGGTGLLEIALRLADMGLRNVVVLPAGAKGWAAAGLPTEEGEGTR